MLSSFRNNLRNIDWVIFISVVILCAFGLISLYSASKNLKGNLSEILMARQITWMISGLILMALILCIDYQRLIDIAPFLYILNLMLLVVVLVLGARILGAQRWISLGWVTFQPSEFIKISLILVITYFLGHKKDSIEYGFLSLFGPLILAVPAFILIVIQPDLGTALTLIAIIFSMIFIAGVEIRYILFIFVAGLLSTPVFWHFLKDYQKKRLLVFINPNLDPLGAGYTIIQSKIAIGSGYLFGKGWLSGTQNQLNFLPERHTDFIFSVVGEEWGFIGSSILVILYFLIIYRGIRIIMTTGDFYGKVMASGIVSIFAFQVIVNIGMTMGLLPVVGLTLPFISYGGSSLVSFMIAMGILLNIGMRRSMI